LDFGSIIAPVLQPTMGTLEYSGAEFGCRETFGNKKRHMHCPLLAAPPQQCLIANNLHRLWCGNSRKKSNYSNLGGGGTLSLGKLEKPGWNLSKKNSGEAAPRRDGASPATLFH
jgi:hypothetical protein